MWYKRSIAIIIAPFTRMTKKHARTVLLLARPRDIAVQIDGQTLHDVDQDSVRQIATTFSRPSATR